MAPLPIRLEVRRLLVQPKICPPCPYSLKPAAITPSPLQKKKIPPHVSFARRIVGGGSYAKCGGCVLFASVGRPVRGPGQAPRTPSLKNLPKNWSLRGRLTARPGLAVGRALDHAARRARITTLEKSQHTGGMGHISAFALPNLKSWRCKIRAIFCSIDLAYRRDASCYSFCVNSGVSVGPHLAQGVKIGNWLRNSNFVFRGRPFGALRMGRRAARRADS